MLTSILPKNEAKKRKIGRKEQQDEKLLTHKSFLKAKHWFELVPSAKTRGPKPERRNARNKITQGHQNLMNIE